MVTAGESITLVRVPLWSKPSPDPGRASCHQSMCWLALSRLNITCPAHKPTPLSELPTGNDGFPHRAHCPFKEINKKKIEIRYFKLILDFNIMKLVLYGLYQPKKKSTKEKPPSLDTLFMIKAIAK